MVNPNPGFLSKRVKRRDQSGITSDRYEFLGLDQAEPDLGDPIVGPSSVTANPFTGDVTNLYFVASDGDGHRYWTKQTDVVAGGVITPGSITVRDEGVIVGSVNQITDINFVGSGVTITNPASWVGAGSSSVDIEIVVTDVTANGNIGNIQYKGSNGFIQGSNDLFYDAINQRVGFGSALPRQKLDVQGNVIISGILTTGDLNANTFTVGNFEIGEDGLIFNIGSGGVGIGTTNPQATLDVLGTVNVTGVLTSNILSTSQLNATNINATGITTSGSYRIGSNEVISVSRQLKNITSLDSVTLSVIETAIANSPNNFDDLNVIGIATINQLGVTGITTTLHLEVVGVTTVGFITATDINVSSAATINHIESQTIDVGFVTATNSYVSGTSTITTVDTDTLYVERVEATNIGIGTTNPQAELDVVGDIRLTGTGRIYDSNNSAGTSGQVILSNGPSSPITWGNPTEITAGAATSVTTVNVSSTDNLYYLTFVPENEGLQSIYLDTDTLAYNPSTNRLGIGTTNPQAELDVVGNINASGTLTVNDIVVEGFTRTVSGITTTTTKNSVVVDSFDIDTFRSARYNIQVTSTGQLVLNGSSSVTELQSGTNYFPGTYTNKRLISTTGIGTDAFADIEIVPEATLPIIASLDGTFTTSGSLVGIETYQSIIFDNVIAPSALENSKVTNVTLTNAGSGYTSFPTFTFESPTIEGNPIPNVGIGSTAIGTVETTKIGNVYLNSVGFVTSIVPTVTIDAPTSGTQATARVGYGISNVTLTSNGKGYTSIPSIGFGGGSATAEVTDIFVTDIRITNPGYGYTPGETPPIVFSAGDAAATNTTFCLPNSYLGFTISNSGLGYTTPPILTVDGPQVGINTGLAEATLGIATFTVTSSGVGYTESPSISNSPSVSGLDATVGLGISDLGIQVSGGSNYSGAPTITFNPVGGIGTGAQGSFISINPDPPNNLEGFIITNPGYGYTVPPTVSITGGGGVGAAVTIRTMIVTDVTIDNIGYGVTVVPTSTVAENPVEFLDFAVTQSGSVGIATTSSVSSVIFSAEGTLGTASTTIISGISTFDTVIRQKTGNVDAINDTTITGINISNVSVGFAVTGTFVQAGTAVSFVNSNNGGTIGLTTNLTNPSVAFGLTFYIGDTLSQRVIVGQGVSGTSIDQTGYGTTVISIGSSEVTISRAATNSGIETNTFYFGTLVTTPGVFQRTLITGITTTGISTGQRVISDITDDNTDVSSIGIGSITLTKNTTNTAVATTDFNFYDVTPAIGAGSSIVPTMGIGRVTVGIDTTHPNLGFGTGYTSLPGIAVTAADGITGGGGIVTTTSFGIDTDCITITNPGTSYTTIIPNVLITPPSASGSAAVGNVGIGLSVIDVTNVGSQYLGNKPSVTISGGSPLVSAAATVNNILLTNVNVDTVGSGYTTADLPVNATFSNVSIGASVGLAVETLSFTEGLGYEETPTITFSTPDLPGGVRATATATLANYGEEFNILPGPGYGNTFVYYITPVTSNTFTISKNIDGSSPIILGFSTLTSHTGYVGGKVNSVSISNPGSGYEVGDIVTFNIADFQNVYDQNTGIGFSFTVGNVVENFQISDVMLLQTVGSATTETHIVEYGGISNVVNLVEFSSNISGSNARLIVNPYYSNNEIKITRTSITK
jgi:hypothetical protein